MSARVAMLVVLGGAVVGFCASTALRAESTPTVTIETELLEGLKGAQHPEVLSFKGIPFAAPPLRALRWRAPQPYRGQGGRRSAQHFAAGCVQDDYNLDWYREVARAFGHDDPGLRNPPFSEDCLYLNVWTPSLDAHSQLPVLVWIHGGANKSGWSFEPDYEGENLAAQGAVVVSIAYRLGIFGFFGHPQLRGSSAPDNFGLLDQIAALRWVHAHIAQLGGDPANVTIAGESAGAGDVGYLLISPLARGLFRRALSESGGFQMLDHDTERDEERLGAALSERLPGHPDLRAMRALDAMTLLDAAKRVLRSHDYEPVIDGRSVTMSPAAWYRRHGIPTDLLIGTNANEWYMYLKEDRASLEHTIAGLPRAVRAPLESRAAGEPTIRLAHDAVYSLTEMHCPAYLMAGAVHAAGHRSWVYRFSRVRPGPGGEALRAYHGAEIPYVFDRHDAWLASDAVDARLTTAMQSYWLAFMRSGDPNGGGVSASWPSFGTTEQIEELGARIGPMAARDLDLCREIAPDLYPGWRGR